MQYYSNSSIGPRQAVANLLGILLEEVELGHDGTGFFIIRPEGATPDPAEVAAQAPPPPEPPTPVTDVDIARQYAGAYQAAQDIIFLLMSRVSTALVIGKHFTPETVNAEGARFTRYHQPEIEAFKLAGRHPDAGDALYAAVEASAGLFPWLKKEDNILSIFATTLPRNPT